MNLRGRALAAPLLLSVLAVSVRAQTADTAARHITLAEAVQLALKQNHVVRIAELQVEEKQHAKEVARSGYFPSVTNESRIFTVTDTQFIQIPAGKFGTVDGTPVPTQPATISVSDMVSYLIGEGVQNDGVPYRSTRRCLKYASFTRVAAMSSCSSVAVTRPAPSAPLRLASTAPSAAITHDSP